MDDAAQAFARDGVACVRQVLDPGQVAAAAAAIDAVLAAPGLLAQVASGTDDPGAFVEDFCRWQEIPQIEELARRARVPVSDPAANLVAAVPGRRRPARAACLANFAALRRPSGRAPGGRGHGPSAVPGGVGRQFTPAVWSVTVVTCWNS
jgi:hypothetical protein